MSLPDNVLDLPLRTVLEQIKNGQLDKNMIDGALEAATLPPPMDSKSELPEEPSSELPEEPSSGTQEDSSSGTKEDSSSGTTDIGGRRKKRSKKKKKRGKRSRVTRR